MYRSNNPRFNVPPGASRGQHFDPKQSRRTQDDLRKNAPQTQSKHAGKYNQSQAPKLPSSSNKTFGPENCKWKSSFKTAEEEDKNMTASGSLNRSQNTITQRSHLFNTYTSKRSDAEEHPSPERPEHSQKSRDRWDVDANSLGQRLSAGPPQGPARDDEPGEATGHGSGTRTAEREETEHREAREGADYGRKGANYGREEADYGREGADYGREGADYGQEEADYGRKGSNYGREEADYGREGADYGREEADYGREGAAYIPESSTTGQLSPPPLLLPPSQHQPPPPRQPSPQQLPRPQLPSQHSYQQSSVFSDPDQLPPSGPEVTEPGKNKVLTEKILISCDLCEVEFSNGQELEEHLDCKTHWDTLEYIQKHNNYDDMAIAFLQDVMLYKCRQCSRAIEDTALQALQEYDHMTKVEMFQCAACNVFVPTSASAVQSHITTQRHIANTKEFEARQRCSCLDKASTMMKELTPQFHSFLKGVSPFE